jgi:hypothetical protein
VNNLPKQPILCWKCAAEICVPCGQAAAHEVDWKTRTGLCSKCKPRVIECFNFGAGIGDAVTAMYAVSGAAAAGHQVKFYSAQAHWLSRASFPGVEVVPSQDKIGIDLYTGYNQNLKAGTSRKQWYCDNISRAAGVPKFTPAVPKVNRRVQEKRIALDDYVLLAPFSAWHTREWPGVHWARLAALLADRGLRVAAIGGWSEGAKLAETFSGTSAQYYYGCDSEWVQDAILGARGVVGNDSGMAHLSGMLGVPTVAVHAQVTAEQLWSDTDVLSVAAKNMSCVGCGWRIERGWRRACENQCSALYSTSPEQVMEALNL